MARYRARRARTRRNAGGRHSSHPGAVSLRQLRRFLRHAQERLPPLRTLALGAFMLAMIAAFATALALQAGRSSEPVEGGWVRLASAGPTDVRTAAQTTPMFQEVVRAPTALGQALRAGQLGAPVLVHAYHPTPGMRDVWVIPLYQPSSQPPSVATPTALLDFAYDSADQRIRAVSFAGPFTQGDPLYQQPFPRLTGDQAVAQLQQARGRAIVSGQQPQLVYFPADLDRIAGAGATLRWTGGGQFPDLAVWRLPASDGQDYLVGVDQAIYSPAQLPLAPGA